MIDTRRLCDYILYFAYQKTQHDLAANGRFTNLWLQKALYYVSGAYLAKFKRPLLALEFEAWMYGPVYPEAYLIYHTYRSNPIPCPAISPSLGLTLDEISTIDKMISWCATKRAAVLVESTHAEEPWRKASNEGNCVGIGITITNNDIMRYFSDYNLKEEL